MIIVHAVYERCTIEPRVARMLLRRFFVDERAQNVWRCRRLLPVDRAHWLAECDVR
jgi:hypothetical protein